MMPEPTFRELDDLVLHLKGLVLVRGLREGRGADEHELHQYDAEIDRLRGRLADSALRHAQGLEAAADAA
jgi:hypothetical protein